MRERSIEVMFFVMALRSDSRDCQISSSHFFGAVPVGVGGRLEEIKAVRARVRLVESSGRGRALGGGVLFRVAQKGCAHMFERDCFPSDCFANSQ